MSDATLARMEHGKYVGVRKESRRDGVCTLKGQTLYGDFWKIERCERFLPLQEVSMEVKTWAVIWP